MLTEKHVQLALAFLQRAQLQGAEVAAFVEVTNALRSMIAPPEIPEALVSASGPLSVKKSPPPSDAA